MLLAIPHAQQGLYVSVDVFTHECMHVCVHKHVCLLSYGYVYFALGCVCASVKAYKSLHVVYKKHVCVHAYIYIYICIYI
jgi:hypothetical protein